MKKILLISLLLILSSCNSKEEETKKSEPERKSWTKENSAPVPQNWLKDFNDPALTKLIAEAEKNNLTLKMAEANLKEAHAIAKISGADRLPILSLDASARRSRTTTGEANKHSIGLNFNWEIDLWGKLKDEEKAALADYKTAEFNYQASRLSLAASAARFWFGTIEAKLQHKLAQDTEKSFQNTLSIIEGRYKNGLTDALDVSLAKADVANAKENTSQRKFNVEQAIRSLEVLLGKYPSAELKTKEELPVITAPLPAGLPAELLQRRPDILAAFQNLKARKLRLSSNKKDLLPGITIVASTDKESSSLNKLFENNNYLWSLAGNLSQPIFQGGRIRNRIKQQSARKDRAEAELALVILEAYEEVENALANEKNLIEKEKQIQTALKESEQAYELSKQKYSKGLLNITTLLNSQRRLFTAKRKLLEVQLQKLTNRVNLYLALGGDFNTGIQGNKK